MIRINLLPQKKQGRRAGQVTIASEGGESQLWMAIVLGLVLLEGIVLLFVYQQKQAQFSQVQKRNNEIRANIENVKRDVAQHGTIKTQLKELREREDAIQRLQSARTGPTATMLELSRIMTPGRGPSADRDKIEQLKRDNPGAVPNPNWDPRRLWLATYKEQDRTVKLTGFARDAEDVSEFLRRLTLSDYFRDVKILPASKSVDAATKLELVKFEMSAKVRY